MSCRADECCQGRKPCPTPLYCCGGDYEEPQPVGYESGGYWPITSNGGASIDTTEAAEVRGGMRLAALVMVVVVLVLVAFTAWLAWAGWQMWPSWIVSLKSIGFRIF